jgi:hypothetical protein
MPRSRAVLMQARASGGSPIRNRPLRLVRAVRPAQPRLRARNVGGAARRVLFRANRFRGIVRARVGLKRALGRAREQIRLGRIPAIRVVPTGSPLRYRLRTTYDPRRTR